VYRCIIVLNLRYSSGFGFPYYQLFCLMQRRNDMKHKMHAIFAPLIAIALLLIPAGMVNAQTAYDTPYVTSITYTNAGNSDTDVTFTFYLPNGSTVEAPAIPLAANASGSLFVGNVQDLGAGFSGSAIVSAGEPILATMVQVPQTDSGSPIKNRPLSNGFRDNASSERFLIPTVLKNQFNNTTRFSVQNVSQDSINLEVNFFRVGETSATHTETVNDLPAGSAATFDAGEISQLGSSFDGSATIDATGGEVVAAALELTVDTSGRASSFEGVPTGTNTVYMATALCKAFGASSAYAVQNTSTTDSAEVTVNYNGGGEQTQSISAGGKFSFLACDSNSSNYSGSATITSTGAPIVAIGKVFTDGGSGRLSTAFAGESAGASSLIAPYVRWTSSANFNGGARQRAFLAIQNIGSNIPSGQNITVRYVDKNGNEVGTHTIPGPIPEGDKRNSNPSEVAAIGAEGEFGYYTDGTFGAGAIIEGPSGSQLIAVVRIQSVVPGVGQVAEDYNAMAP
jgi:hypothetical protein